MIPALVPLFACLFIGQELSQSLAQASAGVDTPKAPVPVVGAPAPLAPGLTGDDIELVIRMAQSKKGSGGARCYARSGLLDISQYNGGFSIYVTGPAGRLWDAAQDAKSKYMTFTRAQVTADMIAKALVVTAYPDAPKLESGSGWHYAPPATHVVIRIAGKNGPVIQPRFVQTTPTSWSNAIGGQFQGQGVTGIFASDDFTFTPAGGDLEVIVIAGQGERTCKFDQKARATIK
jgi:hypothetical protein